MNREKRGACIADNSIAPTGENGSGKRNCVCGGRRVACSVFQSVFRPDI